MACEINRESPDDLDALEHIIKEGTITEESIFDFQAVMEDAAAELAVKHLIGEVVPEGDIEQHMKDRYGEHWERYLLATKIVALTAANPIISDMVREYIWQYAPSGKTDKGEMIEAPLFGTGGLTTEQYNKLNKADKLKQSLKVMSKDDLMVIYSKVFQFATAGTGSKFGKGVIGSFMTQFFGGKQLGQKERSGAYFKFASHITKYYTMIENDIGNFMYKRNKNVRDDNGDIISKEFSGMNDIFRDIENMSVNIVNWKISKDDYQTKSEKMTDFFAMYMSGEIFYDEKSGEFMAYKDHGPVIIYKADGKSFYYDTWPDGSLKQEFTNPISLKKFQGGRYNIPFTKTQKTKYLKLAKKARDIDDRVYNYTKKKFLKSVEKIVDNLVKHFPDLTEVEAKILFFEEWKVKQHSKIIKKLKRIDKSHKKEYMKKYTKFKSTFGKYASINYFINQANESEYKGNHWPVIYGDQVFKIMWDNYIMDLQAKLKIEVEARDAYLETYKGKKLTIGQQKALEEMNEGIKTLEQQISRGIDIQKKKDGLYPLDTITNKELPIARDHNYLKRITGAFDVRLGRKDKGVYYDYLSNIFGAIHRNELTVTLLESLLLSKSEAVDDAIINYYKVPFNDPTLEGGLGPFKWSDEGMSTKLKKLGINLPAETINRNLRRWNKWLTATFLGGTGTAMVNRIAIVQTMQDKNYASIKIALDFWENNKDEVDAFIAKSGVAAFQDFFSKAMVNGKAGFEVDNWTAEQIYAAMLNFAPTKVEMAKLSTPKLKAMVKKTGIDPSKLERKELITLAAKAELKLQLRTILGNSPAYTLFVDKLYSKKEAMHRLKLIKKNKFDAMLDKFVQYTLTQELVINKFAGLIKWKYQAPNKIYKAGLLASKTKYLKKGLYSTAEAYGGFRKWIKMTMSQSEAWIRTTTFLVAVLQAQKLGYIKNDVQMWELTGEDLAKAMEIGRLASNYSNMGLSATDVGASAWGGMGNTMQKFNYWGLQKRGRDFRVIKNSLIVQQSLINLGKNPFFDGKAVAKMLGKSVKNWPQFWNYNKMNVMQKQQAQMLKFLSIGVMPALALDLIVWGPLGNVAFLSILKFVLKRTGGSGAIRGLPSQWAQLITIPLAFGIKMALGMMGSDDEEEWNRFLGQYLRTLPFGYGVTWPFESVALLWMIAAQNDEGIVTESFDVLRPLFPNTDLQQIIKFPVEGMMQYWKDN